MSNKRTRERRIGDLHLSFFAPSATTSRLRNKWVVSSQVTASSTITRRKARFSPEPACDC